MTTTYTETTTTGAGPNGDRDLPGHLRSEAHRRAASPRRTPRGHRRAERVAGARDQESARVDSQRGRADLAHAARCPTIRERSRTLVMRESDRLSRLLTEFLDFARVRVARDGAGGPRRRSRATPRASPRRIPTATPSVRVTCVVPEGDAVASRATRICCIAPCSISRSTRCRRRRQRREVRVEVARGCFDPCRRHRVRGRRRLPTRQRRRPGHSRRRSAIACSIRSSPRSRAAAASVSPSSIARSRRIAASSSSTAVVARHSFHRHTADGAAVRPGALDDRTLDASRACSSSTTRAAFSIR